MGANGLLSRIMTKSLKCFQKCFLVFWGVKVAVISGRSAILVKKLVTSKTCFRKWGQELEILMLSSLNICMGKNNDQIIWKWRCYRDLPLVIIFLCELGWGRMEGYTAQEKVVVNLLEKQNEKMSKVEICH